MSADAIANFYKTNLGRTPSAAEIQQQMNAINGGATLAQIQAGIAGSQEAANYAARGGKANTISNTMQTMVNNPTLPAGAQFKPTMMKAGSGEFLNANDKFMNPGGLNQATTNAAGHAAKAPGQTGAQTYGAHLLGGDGASVTAAQGQVGQNSQVQAAQGTLSGGALAQAAQTTEAENQAGQATAQQGEVDPRSTVQGQLGELTKQLESGNAAWANPAMRNANDQMAARGLGNSSMAGAAVYNAAMESALPIAQQDAQVFQQMGMQNLANRQQTELFNATLRQGITLANLNNRQQSALQNAQTLAAMDLANLNNRQQAAVVNAQSFLQMDLANLNNQQQANILNQQADQQAMLSDQAAINAARQFNASSQQQNDQFFATLGANVNMFNAAQFNALEQFNAGQNNAMKQFNAQLANQREAFNREMALQIDQSNVQWRREINTANTAAKNAANQINAQNMLNLSNTAMNNLWQQFRDEADYAFTSGENALNRSHNLAMAALQSQNAKDMMNDQQEAQFSQLLGSVAGNIILGFAT